MIADPRDIPNGFWLAHDSGSASLGVAVENWVARGDIAKTFTQSTSGRRPTRTIDGITFDAASSQFLYESSAAPDVDNITIFALVRVTNWASLPSIFAKYRTSDNNRVWQLASDTGPVVRVGASSDGTGGTAVQHTIISSPVNSQWYAIVYRKSGTAGRGYVNGVPPTASTSVPSTLKDSTALINIGGRGGDASTIASTLMSGSIRHAGYFNRSLTDTEMADLTDWLTEQWMDVVGISGRTVSTTGPFSEIPGGVTTTVVRAPSGAAISEGTLATWRYAHHPRLWHKAGVLYLMHSLSGTNEDAPGQIVQGWRSTDGGATWIDDGILFAKQDNWSATGAAYSGYSAYPSSFVESNGIVYAVFALDDLTGGVSTASVGLGLFARSWGADGTLGALGRITADSYTPISGFDEIALDSALSTEILAAATEKVRWGGSADGSDGYGWLISSGAKLTEPCAAKINASGTRRVRIWRQVTAQTGDGAVLNKLWTQVSEDSGATYTTASPSDFPDAPTANCILHLSDDRIAFVGNINTTGPVRDPLCLILCERYASGAYAIRRFLHDTPVYSGTFKSGGASYAIGIQIGSRMFVAYSTQKENIEFSSFAIPGLRPTGAGRMAA